MINTNLLQSAIQKYFLSGRHNMVKWRIENNTLTVFAGEAGRACKVTLNDFPLQDSQLGIFDTDKLARLLAITSGDLLLSLQGQKELHNILNIADAHFDLTYTLADPLTIGRSQWVEDPDTFEIEIDLEKEDITHIIKAIENLVETSNNIAKIAVNNGIIKIECLTRSSVESSKDNMVNTLTAAFELAGFTVSLSGDYPGWAPNMDSAILKVSEKGLLKLVFTNESIESVYYVLRNE